MRYLRKPHKEIKYPVKILVDDREKKPWQFDSSHFYMKRQRLSIGDYTIDGYEGIVAFEKKDSLKELFINTALSNVNWFKDQMYRLSRVEYKYLIIQDSVDFIDRAFHEVSIQAPKVKFSKSTLLKWIASLETEFGINVLFTGRKQSVTIEMVEQMMLYLIRFKL
jgi:hypothetical protein